MATDILMRVAEKIVDFSMAPIVWMIPNTIGYTMMATGGMMMLAPLVGRSILGPLGTLAAVSITGVSIMEVFK